MNIPVPILIKEYAILNMPDWVVFHLLMFAIFWPIFYYGTRKVDKLNKPSALFSSFILAFAWFIFAPIYVWIAIDRENDFNNLQKELEIAKKINKKGRRKRP